MKPFDLQKPEKSNPLSLLKDEDGYLLVVVTLIGLILAIIFGVILPRLHSGQLTRAMNNLNEYRAKEAARRGINAVNVGLKDLNNFQELIGYEIAGIDTDNDIITISGNYASLFLPGMYLQVYYSTANDGEYSVDSASNVGTTTEITVDQDITDSTVDGIVCRSRGIFWAVNRLCGATVASTNHHWYKDEAGGIQFVSGCKDIDVSTTDYPYDKGGVFIAIIISRGGSINFPHTDDGDADPKNDGIYFYNNGIQGTTNGSPRTVHRGYRRITLQAGVLIGLIMMTRWGMPAIVILILTAIFPAPMKNRPISSTGTTVVSGFFLSGPMVRGEDNIQGRSFGRL